MKFWFFYFPTILFFTACEIKEKPIVDTYVQMIWNNGNPNVVFEYFNNERTQYKKKKYFENGILALSEDYEQHVLNGKISTFYIDGKKQLEVNYQNGLRNGKALNWYESGSLKEEAEYDKGKLISFEKFYENGQSQGKVSIEDGALNGESIYFYENGSVYRKGYWKNELKHGNWMTYDENSNLEYTEVYENGNFIKALK
ncbi:hypothetical protein BH23BAC1_BH23BAC1_44260 [soil metagenome]